MTTAWTKTGSRSAKAVCTSGSEALTQPKQAATTVSFTAAAAGNSVSIHGITFTAIANGGTAATRTEFAVGAGGSANTDTGTAFAAAVNATTDLHGCTAVNSSGTVTVTAVDYGTEQNSWAVTKVGDPISVGNSTLVNGIDIGGLSLKDVAAVSVKAECVTTSSTITSGSLVAYVLNERTMKWIKYPSADITIPASASLGYSDAFTVSFPGSYIMWVPSGVTISAGNLAIYHDAVDASGRAL